MKKKKIVLAVTGASGIVYGVALAKALKRLRHQVFIVVSDAAKKVAEYEFPKALAELKKCGKVYSEKEIDAPVASGSFRADAMVVCPCSTKTLAAIAHGYSYNLVVRAADVMLKERKRLVLVLRETPLHSIHLENALKLSRMGVIVLPACPGFYPKPKEIKDLINHLVGKVLDSLEIENKLFKRWGVKK